MTITFDKTGIGFDPDPSLDVGDRAQPLNVEPSDTFVILTQWDGTGEYSHCILVERRDKQALIEALMRA